MRTTLDLPDPLRKRAKMVAAESGRKLKDDVAEALRVGLDSNRRENVTNPPRVHWHSDLGYPVIGGNLPTSTILLQNLLEIERHSQSEEDLVRADASR